MNIHENTQYEKEKFALKYFLKKNPIVSWKDLIQEKDRIVDFRFNTAQGIVGIELTRFSKDAGREAKRQRFYDAIIQDAYKVFYDKYKINLHVDVNLWHKEHISSKNAQQFSHAIVDTISQNLDYIKTSRSLETVKLDLSIDDHIEGRLYIDNFGQEIESLWTRTDPFWVRSSPYEELQEIINKKNNKIERYKSCSDKIYLLITGNKRLPEEAVHFDDDILKQRFYAKFDKVFFFDVCSKELYPLKITSCIEQSGIGT